MTDNPKPSKVNNTDKNSVIRDLIRKEQLPNNYTTYLAVEAGIKQGITLAQKVGLDHFIDNFITGEHHRACKACKLLKEYKIKGY